MRRIILSIIFLGVTASVSFGQGTFFFGGSTKGVWDNFTTGVPTLTTSSGIDVSFLIGTGTPTIAAIAVTTPTNVAFAGPYVTLQSAWYDVLNDPNYHLATNGNALVVANANAGGSWGYNNSSTFTDPYVVANTAYNVYVVGWNGDYATPQLAAAAYAAVGWSPVFSYTPQSPTGNPPAPMNTLVTPFGVGPGLVPEPGTIALAGMGIASLLAFRRRNSK